MRPTVLILVKKTDDKMVGYGIAGAQTMDYAVAKTLRTALNDEGIEGIICNTDHSAITSSMEQLQAASALVHVALSPQYLNSARSAIEMFCKVNYRRIIFLTEIPSKDMREILSANGLSNGIPSEIYTLSSENTPSTLAKGILHQLRKEKSQTIRAFPSVRGILKRSMPLPEQLPRVIERAWLVSQLDIWVTTAQTRICWIKGEHGTGKTSFIADYCAQIKSGTKKGFIGGGIYCCTSTDTRTQDSVRIIRTIAHELCCCVEGYEEAIRNTVTDTNFNILDPENTMRELLIDPFVEHPELVPGPEKGKFVFAVDGIDELKTNKLDALEGFLNLLKPLNTLNPFIRIIITSTPDKTINTALTKIHAKRIDLTREHRTNQMNDAERFLCNELDFREIPYTETEISQILQKAEWNFDYLQHFIAQCNDNDSKKLPPLDQLPMGLLAMYAWDFEQMFSQQYYHEKVKPIIQILAAAYEPLTITNIVQILQKESYEIEDVVSHSRLTQFLKESKRGSNTAIALYSVSLENWLCQDNHHFSIDINAGKAKMIEWIQKGNSGDNKYYSFYNNDYLRKYGLQHLLDSRKTDIIGELIICSNSDNFEKLKALFGNLFVNDDSARRGWDRLLLQLFREKYDCTIRIRDILVYIYRYILKRKGPKHRILSEIIKLLKAKNEEIRAELLRGEGIENDENALQHFQATIDRAKVLIEEMRAKGRINLWWDIRMCGVAYNRLANLQNKLHHRNEALEFYSKGRQQFEEAKQLFHSGSADERRLFSEDITIIDRDLGISNERLGDISFDFGKYEEAKEYYQQFYHVCRIAYENQSNMRTKWDLSISLLRLGDTECCLGEAASAQNHYQEALGLRREILQHMRSDCMDMLPRPFYIDFEAPMTVDIGSKISRKMFKESRDIDPIRDIAMCYARLGDLAFSLNQTYVAAEYYETLVRLCDKNHDELRTAASEQDLVISKSRKSSADSCMPEV